MIGRVSYCQIDDDRVGEKKRKRAAKATVPRAYPKNSNHHTSMAEEKSPAACDHYSAFSSRGGIIGSAAVFRRDPVAEGDVRALHSVVERGSDDEMFPPIHRTQRHIDTATKVCLARHDGQLIIIKRLILRRCSSMNHQAWDTLIHASFAFGPTTLRASLPFLSEERARRLHAVVSPTVVRHLDLHVVMPEKKDTATEDKLAVWSLRERAPFGDLFEVIGAKKGHHCAERQTSWWSTEAILRMLIPLAKSIVAMHAAGMIHRDIKLENIVVFPAAEAVSLALRPRQGESLEDTVGRARTVLETLTPDDVVLKWTDFEYLTQHPLHTDDGVTPPNHFPLGERSGTPLMLPPTHLKYDAPASLIVIHSRIDVFAMGHVLYSCLSGFPVADYRCEHTPGYDHVVNEGYRPGDEAAISPILRKLISRMLHVECAQRPPMSEVVKLFEQIIADQTA